MACEHCGMFHPGAGKCPRIKAVEYYENGTVKRIEYHATIPVVLGNTDFKTATAGQ